LLADHHERGQSELRASEQYITSDIIHSSPESFLRHLFEKWEKKSSKNTIHLFNKIIDLGCNPRTTRRFFKEDQRGGKNFFNFFFFEASMRVFETSTQVYIQSIRKYYPDFIRVAERIVETGGIKPDQGEFLKTDLICEIFQILVTAKRVSRERIYKRYGDLGIDALNTVLAEGYFYEDNHGFFDFVSREDFLYYGKKVAMKLIQYNVRRFEHFLGLKFSHSNHRSLCLDEETIEEAIRRFREIFAWLAEKGRETQKEDGIVMTFQTIIQPIDI